MKLTKELAELIGFWKMRRTRKGVGVIGDLKIQEKFVKKVLELKLVPPEKIIADKKAVWFSHIKIKNFFEKTIKNQAEIFDRRNNLSAAYLRGMYESTGEGPVIRKASLQDQLLIERLGFTTKNKGSTVLIRDFDSFKNFIYPEKKDNESKVSE
ncbi:MAG: hypothetical protein RMI79_02935 [Nitrososphaerota archaeon]|nr:hypothetical protein [Nitrososphaerota archaeon]